MLHEPLDAEKTLAVVVAQSARHLGLQIEGQTLLGFAGEKMQVTAGCPEKGFAVVEGRDFLRREDFVLSLAVLPGVEVGREPMQHVEVAQSSFALLDVWLDPVPRDACSSEPLFPLGKFRRDELALRALHDTCDEARP